MSSKEKMSAVMTNFWEILDGFAEGDKTVLDRAEVECPSLLNIARDFLDELDVKAKLVEKLELSYLDWHIFITENALYRWVDLIKEVQGK